MPGGAPWGHMDALLRLPPSLPGPGAGVQHSPGRDSAGTLSGPEADKPAVRQGCLPQPRALTVVMCGLVLQTVMMPTRIVLNV
jgi:hypothetical protein